MVRLETLPALTVRTDCLDGTDACVTPVLEKDEAPSHPHNKARASFLPSGLPGPAPRLSRTPASASSGGDSLEWGAHTMEILAEEGYDQVNPPLPSFLRMSSCCQDTIQRLLQERVAQQADVQQKL